MEIQQLEEILLVNDLKKKKSLSHGSPTVIEEMK